MLYLSAIFFNSKSLAGCPKRLTATIPLVLLFIDFSITFGSKQNISSSIVLTESSSAVEYTYRHLSVLDTVKAEFEYLVQQYGYDLDRIKLITGLIYLNMSPMHTGNFSKMLWFEAITILSQYANK